MWNFDFYNYMYIICIRQQKSRTTTKDTLHDSSSFGFVAKGNCLNNCPIARHEIHVIPRNRNFMINYQLSLDVNVKNMQPGESYWSYLVCSIFAHYIRLS